MGDKDPNDFANYEMYLNTHLWPSVQPRSGEVTTKPVVFEEMPPQYAAAALAKLVRWARIAPVGDIAMFPDEDSREYEVRTTELGKALAARAVNLDPEIFFATYGEFGAGEDVDPHQVAANLAVEAQHAGLDWSLEDLIKLGLKQSESLLKVFRIVSRFS